MKITDELKQAWRAEAPAAPPPSLEDVRSTADRFYRQIRHRNRREYIACALVSLFFAAIALLDPGPAHRIAAMLVILGCGIVAWQLHRRAPAVPLPEEAGLPLIVHQRAQLVRQRDALAGVASWYLMPMLPGLLLFGAAPAIEAAPPLRPDVWVLAYLGFVMLVFAGVWWLNRLAARRLQAEIGELDAMETEQGVTE